MYQRFDYVVFVYLRLIVLMSIIGNSNDVLNYPNTF